MTFYELAATVFILATFIKFGIGSLPIEYEMDALAELGACVLLAAVIGAPNFADVSFGGVALAAAIAFVTMTLWAGIQLWRMRTLFAITRGTR